jgi:hypothetical protein
MEKYKPNYNFEKDYARSVVTEKQIADFLVKTQDMTFIAYSKDLEDEGVAKSDFDVRMKFNKSQKIVDIEIKEDLTCAHSRNIGVEFECRRKPSGIAISKADFYLYKAHLPDEEKGKKGVYIIQTSKLKQMIVDKLYHRIVVGGDEGSYSKNYLFRLDVVKSNFKFLGYVD